MPCSLYDSLLLNDFKKEFCPKCTGVKIKDRQQAISVIKQNLDQINLEIVALLRKNLSKNKLLLELAWQRESFSTVKAAMYLQLTFWVS